MLGNRHDAEDAAQETFLKAFRNVESFEPRVPLYTWIFRIGINTCLDHKKKAFSRHQRSYVDFESITKEIPSLSSPENHLQIIELTESVQKALLELPVKLRSVIILKEVEGLPYEEISRVLKISIGTVKSRISRAREQLRKKLRNKI
jgi:RNA polymerase sigma-70 factor (ECF subfamily)